MQFILSWVDDRVLKSDSYVCLSDLDFEYFDFKIWELLNKGYSVSIYVVDREK